MQRKFDFFKKLILFHLKECIESFNKIIVPEKCIFPKDTTLEPLKKNIYIIIPH